MNSGDGRDTGRNNETTERAEITTDQIKSFKGEYHLGVAVRFGPDFMPHDDRTLIVQIKPQFSPSRKNSPNFAVYANKSFDRWKVCNDIQNLDDCDYQQGQLFSRNTWHTIVVSQNASRGNDGWLKFFVDGKLVYHHTGPTKYDAREIFSDVRVGIYRNNVSHPQSLDVDNFILSRELNAVADFLKLDASKLR